MRVGRAAMWLHVTLVKSHTSYCTSSWPTSLGSCPMGQLLNSIISYVSRAGDSQFSSSTCDCIILSFSDEPLHTIVIVSHLPYPQNLYGYTGLKRRLKLPAYSPVRMGDFLEPKCGIPCSLSNAYVDSDTGAGLMA